MHTHTHILSHSHTAIYLHLHYLSTQYPCASVAELFPLKLKYFLMNISACRVLSRRRLAPCKSTSLATRNKIKLIHKDDRGFLRFRIIFPVPLCPSVGVWVTRGSDVFFEGNRYDRHCEVFFQLTNLNSKKHIVLACSFY